jgi:hypothetical protein
MDENELFLSNHAISLCQNTNMFPYGTRSATVQCYSVGWDSIAEEVYNMVLFIRCCNNSITLDPFP